MYTSPQILRYHFKKDSPFAYRDLHLRAICGHQSRTTHLIEMSQPIRVTITEGLRSQSLWVSTKNKPKGRYTQPLIRQMKWNVCSFWEFISFISFNQSFVCKIRENPQAINKQKNSCSAKKKRLSCISYLLNSLVFLLSRETLPSEKNRKNSHRNCITFAQSPSVPKLA